VTLLPSLAALRDEIAREQRYPRPPRVGAAGGIATPWGVHAAFSLGAAYVLVGSVHQSCREAGTSDAVRQLLAEAEPTDVAMAPAADMFELGVHLQVLRRGTMFAMRAKQLLELYRAHGSWEEIPSPERAKVEKTHFRASFDEIWARTREFFLARDPEQVARAERDAKHRLALAFRWYLGLSSAWANRGDPDRRLDYQIWCGPAMGAFNEWARGSELEAPAGRRVAVVARALMEGAAKIARAEHLRRSGVALPDGIPDLRPRAAPTPVGPAPAAARSRA
jgi:PfaD family protein